MDLTSHTKIQGKQNIELIFHVGGYASIVRAVDLTKF